MRSTARPVPPEDISGLNSRVCKEDVSGAVVATVRPEANAVPAARPHRADPTAMGWKNTLVLPLVSRARNCSSGCFVVSNPDDHSTPRVRTSSHILLVSSLGVAGQEDAEPQFRRYTNMGVCIEELVS